MPEDGSCEQNCAFRGGFSPRRDAQSVTGAEAAGILDFLSLSGFRDRA